MSAGKGIYRRGEYWLDFDRGAGGKPASPNYFIWWYDASTGHQRRKSTRTPDLRLATDRLDQHYYATHKPATALHHAYTVSEALTDYWLMHGQQQASAEAIKARLKHIALFIDHEADAGRINDPFTPDQITDQFIARFRTWALAQPIVARRKNKAGAWVDGASRPRKASTVEESVIQLKAALNFAADNQRISAVPRVKHKTRAEVTARRNDRLSVAGIAELLDYALRGGGQYITPHRLMALRRYIIASICTLARPDAILDLSVARPRGQWQPDAGLIDMNPAGRVQTTKRRAIIPATSIMRLWLDATDEWFVCQNRVKVHPETGEEEMTQHRVRSIRSAWDTARAALGIPEGRGPKYLRHSMATILANRRVPPFEISLALGHQVLDPTTEIYVVHDPQYLQGLKDGIEEVLAELAKSSPTALHPDFTRKPKNISLLMTG